MSNDNLEHSFCSILIIRWINTQLKNGSTTKVFFYGRNALTIAIMAQDTQYIEPFSPIKIIFIKVANDVFLVNRGKISNFELQSKKVVNRGSKFP